MTSSHKVKIEPVFNVLDSYSNIVNLCNSYCSIRADKAGSTFVSWWSLVIYTMVYKTQTLCKIGFVNDGHHINYKTITTNYKLMDIRTESHNQKVCL